MCEPESVLGILSGVPRTVAGSWKPVAAVAAVVGVCAFVATYAVELAAAVLVFVVVMGAVIWRMRLPDRMPQATVTTRPRQGVRAVTAGRRAVGGATVVEGSVLRYNKTAGKLEVAPAAEGEKVVR